MPRTTLGYGSWNAWRLSEEQYLALRSGQKVAGMNGGMPGTVNGKSLRTGPDRCR